MNATPASNRKKQVFKAKGGQMETLHKGFLDLRELGPVQMRRSSEIKLDETTQKYYIEFLEPPLVELGLNEKIRNLQFDTYDLAVEQEVMWLNEARKNGTI